VTLSLRPFVMPALPLFVMPALPLFVMPATAGIHAFRL
jgi:hypothetical protein